MKKIGEKFNHFGVDLIVKQQSGCRGCYFLSDDICHKTISGDTKCCRRDDGLEVVFKKSPYFMYGK